MKRLTVKNKSKGYYFLPECKLTSSKNKLGRLEDIEEKLGIPLEVLFKALKDGFWVMTKEDGIEFMYRPQLFHCEGRYCFREDIFWFEAIVETKDYGKTWSFVQEELIKNEEKLQS